MKTSTASTFALLIRIIKHELTSDLTLHIIHLSTNNSHNRLTINDNLQPLSLDNLIKLSNLLLFNIVHIICQTITPIFT